MGGSIAKHVNETRSEHLEKAPMLIVVTELGIETSASPEQPSKALLPIVVTVLGMMVLLQPAINLLVELSIIALQPSLES